MKVLLLNPPFLPKFSRESRSPATTKGGTLYYPYYLAYATGVLEKNGFDVKLIDAVANGWDKEQTVNIVKNFSPQLIVIETSTPSVVNDMQVADALKEALPSIYVALVGTHPSVLPEEVLKSCKADLVCIGEYDYTILDLARAIEKSKPLYTVDGISYKDYKGIRHTKPRKLIENLDELPFVSEVYKKHLNIRDYFYASVTHPQVTILTARGCPFNCAFCLTSDMPIITEKGMHNIKDLVEQFNFATGNVISIGKNILPKVLSHDGKFHSVEAVMKRKVNSDIIEIKVQGNPFRLRLTPNHKIYALKKKKKNSKKLEPELTESSKVKKGDFVSIPRITETKNIDCILVSKLLGLPEEGYKRGLKIKKEIIKKILNYGKKGLSTRKISKLTGVSKSRAQTILKDRDKIFKNVSYKIFDDGKFIRCSKSKKPIPSNIKLDKDFMLLCGYYLSEGHVHVSKDRPNSKSLVFTFNKEEKKYIEDVVLLIKKYFGINSKISDTKTAYQVIVNSTLVSGIFMSLFGTGSMEKKIPLEWLFLSKEKQLSLLSGIFRGDGYFCGKKLGFNTVSKFLAEEAQMILHRLGFATSITITPKRKYESNINGRKIQFKHDRYDVIVFGNEKQRKLNSLMGNTFEISRKKAKKSNWLINDNFIFFPVVSVNKKKFIGKVYNISVKNSHSYTINGVSVANCNTPFKFSYRARTPENIVEEFQFIQKELPEVKEVMIEDDTFPVNKDRTTKICDLLIERGIKLKWSCNARVDTDFETLKKMKEAGCRLVCVGFETPSQEVLDNIHKRTTKDIQIEFMKNARKAGLLVHGCFILGLPGDTKETIKKTVEFAKELNPDTAQFYPMMIYPGTEAYEWAKKNNFLVTEDFSKWLTKEGLHNCVITRPDLANIELLKLCDDARKSFYLRPSYVTYKIKQMIANPSEIRRTLKSLKIFYKYLAKGSVQEDEIEEFHSS